MSDNTRANADYWRQRAAEVVLSAGQIKDASARAVLLRIAEDYERLARRAEAKGAQRT